MKDFTINEAADEAALNFPGIPQDVVRHICNSVMNSVTDIVEKKKGRIRLQHGDIHTVYFDVTPSVQRAAFADLNEVEFLTKEQEAQTIIERKNAQPNLSRKNERLYRRYKRIHNPGPDTGKTYPQ